MFFVVETKKNSKVLRLVNETKKRMLINHMGVSHMDIALQTRDKYYRIFVVVKPTLTNTTVYAAFFILVPAVLLGWGIAGYAVPAFLLFLKIFETDWFGFGVLKYVLKKNGYEGIVERIPLTKLVEEALLNGTE